MRVVIALISFAAAAGILLTGTNAFSQGRSTGGASSFGGLGAGGSGLGSSSLGGGGFGGSSFGQSSLGQSSFGQSSIGSGGFGQAGAGVSAFGSAGAGGFGAETAGPTNQVFVGRTAADLESFFGGSFQQFQNAVQRSERAGRGDTGGTASQRRPKVRVKLRVSEELRTAIAAAGAGRPASSGLRFSAATENVTRLFDKKGLPGVSLTAESGVLTLRGAVQSESERLVAEKLAAIEPGVDRVVNELTVAQTDAIELIPVPGATP